MPLIPAAGTSEPDNLALFYHSQQTSTLAGHITGPIPGNEQEIISTIKTIRNNKFQNETKHDHWSTK
jgi:hypothetical protein